jgi:hypothetical protein
LPTELRREIGAAYDEKFEFLFTRLAVGNTKETVARFIKPTPIHKPQPHEDLAVVPAAPDDADLSD